ncbi:MAG: hypothetical protein IT232_10305 [Flavobacteriales bacterium]|nr:hypothetical protein [Flavobacteriales bacterium]
MNKLLLLLTLLLFTETSLKAQESTDTIQINKTFFGTVFKLNDKPLKPKQINNMMKNYPEAYDEMTKARDLHIASDIIGGVGGFLVGWSVGSAVSGGKISPNMFRLGAVLIGVSIPFHIFYDKKTTKVVRNYNQHIVSTSGKN